MRKKIARITAILLLLLFVSVLPVQAAILYTRTHATLYTIRHIFTITNTGIAPVSDLSLDLPAFNQNIFSNQYILSSRWNINPTESSLSERGDVTARFTLPRLNAGASAEIILETLVRNFSVTFHLEQTGGNLPQPSISYIQPEEKVESAHPAIIAKANEITAGIETIGEKARAIFAFVQQYMTYDLDPTFRNKGALSALNSGRGVCEDYAALFVALCRAVGIPARMVYGYMQPRNSPRFEGHAWAEFFLPSHGWIPVEPTVISAEIPWNFFAALPPEARYIPLSLQPRMWQWSWRGARTVNLSSSSNILAGQVISMFIDVSASHWAYSVIDDLALRGIITGEQGFFQPRRAITRAEFAQWIASARNLTHISALSPFSDVQPNNTFYSAIKKAAQAGLIAGFPDGTFRPFAPITREQVAAILVRALVIDGRNVSGNISLAFADTNTIAAWALPSVATTVNMQLFRGDHQNNFRPQANTSRAEAAVLIHRYINMPPR